MYAIKISWHPLRKLRWRCEIWKQHPWMVCEGCLVFLMIVGWKTGNVFFPRCSMGLVYSPTSTMHSAKCRYVIQSHGAYGLGWLFGGSCRNIGRYTGAREGWKQASFPKLRIDYFTRLVPTAFWQPPQKSVSNCFVGVFFSFDKTANVSHGKMSKVLRSCHFCFGLY